MKNLFTISVLFLFLFSSISLSAVNSVQPVEDLPLTSVLGDMTAEDFVQLRAKEIKQRTGKKLKLKERIVLKVAQHKVKKQLKNGELADYKETYENAERRFSLGGFLLGFFLGLIGLLIALLFGRNAFRSALLGFLVWLVVLLIIVLGNSVQ